MAQQHRVTQEELTRLRQRGWRVRSATKARGTWHWNLSRITPAGRHEVQTVVVGAEAEEMTPEAAQFERMGEMYSHEPSDLDDPTGGNFGHADKPPKE